MQSGRPAACGRSPPHLRLSIGGGIAASSPDGELRLEEIPIDFAEAEALLIQRALDRAAGNVTQAAKMLGIDRNKVYRIQAKSGFRPRMAGLHATP